MKKWLWIGAVALMLTACGTEETFETISDEPVQAVSAEMREIFLSLPPEAVSPVLESPERSIYICGDYEIYQQTLEAGDLAETVETVSGFDLEDLTVMETRQGEMTRYEFVWASAGETGDRLGRAAILDDGHYHYCLSVLGDAETAGEHRLVWQDLFASFTLI